MCEVESVHAGDSSQEDDHLIRRLMYAQPVQNGCVWKPVADTVARQVQVHGLLHQLQHVMVHAPALKQ